MAIYALFAVIGFTLLPIPLFAALGRLTHGSVAVWWRS